MADILKIYFFQKSKAHKVIYAAGGVIGYAAQAVSRFYVTSQYVVGKKRQRKKILGPPFL